MDKITRRKLLIIGTSTFLTTAIVPIAMAGRFRDAVIEFVEKNYGDDIETMSKDLLRRTVAKVLPIEKKIERSSPDLQEHVEETWDKGSGNRRHTEKCPYCISIAQEVEKRVPQVTPVANRIPRCFIIQGAGYVTSNWGSLHRYVQGQVGPAEGYIWFSNGQYIGIGNNGVRLPAQPAC